MNEEIYILCDKKNLAPIRIKLKGGDPQVAFTDKMIAERYILVKGLAKELTVFQIQELTLEDNMGILIEDNATAIQLLVDADNFEMEPYYKPLTP